MSAITKGVYSALVSDAALSAMLADYRGAPAIFTTDPAPSDATLPYIVTAGAVTDTPADTKTSRGREVVRDIRCYTEATGSADLVEEIAERVRAILHRRAITVTGFRVYISQIVGPFAGPAEDTAYGRILTAQITLEET